jgi:hypothetical protein
VRDVKDRSRCAPHRRSGPLSILLERNRVVLCNAACIHLAVDPATPEHPLRVVVQ